jgi:hypothetical protein
LPLPAMSIDHGRAGYSITSPGHALGFTRKL